jgi:hypothetical protein
MRDTALVMLMLAPLGSSASDPCPPATPAKDGSVLIAWITDVRETTQFGADIETTTTKVEPFRPIAVLKGKAISETSGASISKGQPFWLAQAPDKQVQLTSVSSFLDHMNEAHCVYYGTVNDPNLPQWSLLTSKPLPGVFRVPTKAEKAKFRKAKPECIVQGDYAEDQKPPCSRAEILAVSDINKNGKPEYWATEPYMWDTGLTVWEDTGQLNTLFQVCVGCSD